jgi:hypothetical protein
VGYRARPSEGVRGRDRKKGRDIDLFADIYSDKICEVNVRKGPIVQKSKKK